MHIHILGICGTFMGSLAVLAKQLGHEVSGSDSNVYPPMSTQLEQLGIQLQEGYEEQHLKPAPDLVIIGNAMSRGNAAVEYVLNEGLAYLSGPQWLAQYVLQGRWVLGVAGTHGKTTTSAILTWILSYAGLKPGYLIGGVTNNFPQSADLGDSDFFVVEADEYDSAFFDKRSKFVHYSPRTAILNNLEFDHADIFADLAAIEKQFHHLVRTIPGNGLILTPFDDANLESVLEQGCWSGRQTFGIDVPAAESRQRASADRVFWNAELAEASGSQFDLVKYGGDNAAELARHTVRWQMSGLHNVNNAVAAIAAAHHVGVSVDAACAALTEFAGVKRRQELRGEVAGIRVYDDFAHHPTAIKITLEGLAAKLQQETGRGKLIAVIEPRSNTMQMGIHQDELNQSCLAADMVIWFKPQGAGLDFESLLRDSKVPAEAFSTVAEIVDFLTGAANTGDSIVVMSNGGFGGIHEKLLAALQ